MPTALITGASRGLGRAAAHALARRGWSLIVDARRADDLDRRDAGTGRRGRGSRRCDRPRSPRPPRGGSRRPARRAGEQRQRLGPSPQPPLASYPLDELGQVYDTNVFAPLALIQVLAAPLTAAAGTIVNVSSDAATGAYPGWGGYGSAKAALDQLTAVLATEQRSLRCYAFDPGDMRTDMHQQAFPGEDISDRPEPEAVVPALLRLLDERPPSGRYRASDLAVPAVTP